MGLDTVSYCLVMEELGRADSSVRGIVSVNVGLVGKTIAKWGTDEQKARVAAAKLASGEALGCYALTEPGSGSDPSSLVDTRASATATTGCSPARRSSSRSARGPASRSSSRARRRGRARADLLPRADGLRRASARRRSRASSGCGRRTRPSCCSTACASPTRTGSARRATASRWRCRRSTTGASRSRPAASESRRAVSTRASRYAAERQQFGKPIARFQLVQELIADIAVETEAARLLTWRAARPRRRGRAAHARVVGREVLRERGVGARRERRRPGARRLRLRRRVSGRQVPPRRARDDAVRRHEPDPEADHRPGADRRERFV